MTLKILVFSFFFDIHTFEKVNQVIQNWIIDIL